MNQRNVFNVEIRFGDSLCPDFMHFIHGLRQRNGQPTIVKIKINHDCFTHRDIFKQFIAIRNSLWYVFFLDFYASGIIMTKNRLKIRFVIFLVCTRNSRVCVEF